MKSVIVGTLLLGSLTGVVFAKAADSNFLNNDVKKTTKSPIDNSTTDICDKEFPEEFRRDFPYYLTGYDFEHRPVIWWEVGIWKYRKWADYNETSLALSYANADAFWCRMLNLKSPFADAEEGITLILDMTGFHPSELLSIKVNKLHVYQMRRAERYSNLIGEAIMINANVVSTSWLNLVRPVAGRVAGRMEVYGIKKATYLPVLRGKMDNSVIPPWVTGEEKTRKFEPLKRW